MSETTSPTSREPLGVGSILSDTFAIVFRHLVPMLVIGAIPSIVGIPLTLAVLGRTSQDRSQDMVQVLTNPWGYAAAQGVEISPVAMLIMWLASIVLWGFAAAAMTHAAYAAGAGSRVDIGQAVRTGLARLLPVVLCMALGEIAVYLGLLALIVPGLYLMALWVVIIPAIVVDRLGFGAFGRSAALSEGYRWPLIGLILLFMLVAVVISLVSAVVQVPAYSAGTAGVIAGTIIDVVMTAFFYALDGTMTALIYARLREIKEGTSMHALARVFD